MKQLNFLKSVTEAGQSALQTAANIGSTVSNTASQITKNAQESLRKWVCFSDNDTLAFYGVLFAVAAADGKIDAEELSLILNSPDIAQMSKEAKDKIQHYSVEPPDLQESLKKLANADIKLRFGLMFYILNVVWADKVMTPEEKQAIKLAQKELGISAEQVKAINIFVQTLGKIREQGLSDQVATKAIKNGCDNLTKVGVPVESFFPPDTGLDVNNISINYSDEMFIEKIGALAAKAGKKVIECTLILFYAIQHPDIPVQAKLLIPAPLLYFMSPLDGIPDLMPGVGYSDDIGVLMLGVVKVFDIIANNNELKNSIMQSTRQKMQEWFGEDYEDTTEELIGTSMFA